MPRNTRYPKGTPIWASQNFLTSRAGIRRLIGLADIGSSDHVLEIGPGKGHITRELLPRCGRLTAVELDPRLWAGLRERFEGEDKLELIKGDFLKYPLPKGPYKVFANLPFSGTSAILKKLTRAGRLFAGMGTWSMSSGSAFSDGGGNFTADYTCALAFPHIIWYNDMVTVGHTINMGNEKEAEEWLGTIRTAL